MMPTAFQEGYRVLYHWQPFNEARLAKLLAERAIYCASPSQFNDPWDCKPHFNTEILADPSEREKHVHWAVDLCRRRTGMSDADIARMVESLRADTPRAAALIREISEGTASDISLRYRVYCLGPDVESLMMWAHYANSHSGVCLEFSLRNEILCTALKCEYRSEFPLMRAYASGDADVLAILLTKAEAWSYEREYRLIAQERANALSDDTLLTENSLLQLPEGALTSIIVGCQADYKKVATLVKAVAPGVRVRRAVRVPNKYQLRIED